MDFITAYAIYATGAILLVGAFAARVPHEDVAVVFLLAMAWPLSITAILFILVLNATGWELDAAVGKTLFGFRKPTNPEVKGFAVTVFYGEVQFYKMR